MSFNLETREFNKNEKIIVTIGVVILILITLLTNYFGSTDVGDYADSAKYFAGKFHADLRNSHSYLYGFLHAPLLKILDSFILLKLSSIFFLLLIIYSLYIMSNKNKKVLLLSLFSPIIWYMAPWISPIPIASLCLLWAYYFIKRYDKTDNIKFLLASGFLIGLGWTFWNTIMFIAVFMVLSFLCNKKLADFIYFSVFILIGLLPIMILDYRLFHFPFYSLIKTTAGNFSIMLFGGIYGSSSSSFNLLATILILLTFPLAYWKFYKSFKEYKKDLIFLSLCLLLIISNSQLRYALALVPMVYLLIGNSLTNKQFKKQMILSLILLLIFIFPYIIQLKYGINGSVSGSEITGLIAEHHLNLDRESYSSLIKQDLSDIEKDYKNESFLVGNGADDYEPLAYLYWGNGINSFLSVQDYDLFLKNQTIIFQKTIMPMPRIPERRQIWISGGISRGNDHTDYSSIKYAIGINQPVKIDGFSVVKKYNLLYLSKR